MTDKLAALLFTVLIGALAPVPGLSQSAQVLLRSPTPAASAPALRSVARTGGGFSTGAAESAEFVFAGGIALVVGPGSEGRIDVSGARPVFALDRGVFRVAGGTGGARIVAGGASVVMGRASASVVAGDGIEITLLSGEPLTITTEANRRVIRRAGYAISSKCQSCRLSAVRKATAEARARADALTGAALAYPLANLTRPAPAAAEEPVLQQAGLSRSGAGTDLRALAPDTTPGVNETSDTGTGLAQTSGSEDDDAVLLSGLITAARPREQIDDLDFLAAFNSGGSGPGGDDAPLIFTGVIDSGGGFSIGFPERIAQLATPSSNPGPSSVSFSFSPAMSNPAGTVTASTGRARGLSLVESTGTALSWNDRRLALSFDTTAAGVVATATGVDSNSTSFSLAFSGRVDAGDPGAFQLIADDNGVNLQIASADLLDLTPFQPASGPAVTDTDYAYLQWGVIIGALETPNGEKANLLPLGFVSGAEISAQDIGQFAGTASYAGHAFGTAIDASGARTQLGSYTNTWDFGARKGTATLAFDGRSYSGETNVDTTGFSGLLKGVGDNASVVTGSFVGLDPALNQPRGLAGDFIATGGTADDPYVASGVIAAERQ